MLSTNVLCIKKRKKRSYCIADRSEYYVPAQEKGNRSAGGAVAMLQITEDTPPDMLAGAMDLTVHLPSGKSVKMSVERSTPMMDLLVQVTTNHHLQLSGYTLQALGMAPSSEHSDKILPYKPNTPIGALDTQHIRVVPKSRTVPVPKNVPAGHQPFESTFRLKVHLPRNQLYVTRVSQSVHLKDIMKKVCEEKNLDPMKYEFRHPGNLDEKLDPKLTLSDYQITEVYIVLKGTVSLNQAFSSTDIMALRKEEERKQMHNKTGGGVFNLIFRRGKSSSGSLSSDNRSISPTQSDDSRSVTPPAVQPPIITPPQPEPPAERPKPPQRKRRPAPKPPLAEENQKNAEEPEAKKTDAGLTICHSRNSSDSSGYHEASILSDNCNTSLPRRPKSTVVNGEVADGLSGAYSQSTSNLTKMSAHSKSTSSLAFPNRKKKSAPPPPPPVLKPASSVTNLETPSPVVASQPPAAAQPESLISTANLLQPHDSFPPPSPPPVSEDPPPDQDDPPKAEPIAEPKMVEVKEKKSAPVAALPAPVAVVPAPVAVVPAPVAAVPEPVAVVHAHVAIVPAPVAVVPTPVAVVPEPKNFKEIEDLDWQYQLPSPPKAFRDSSPVAFTDPTTYTEGVTDSVVTSPELFEKLKTVKENQTEKETVSDVTSMVSEEEKPILNTLSLENLEKRKSLVYNRELATSLKAPEEAAPKTETFSSSLTKFEQAYEEMRRSSQQREVAKSTLPNFKITTYDNPKQKLNIFEDDTVRSNTMDNRRLEGPRKGSEESSRRGSEEGSGLQKTPVGRSMENVSSRKNSFEEEFKKPTEYRFYRPQSVTPRSQYVSVLRSGSFSTDQNWSPSKPVTRSKSHVALNKYKEEKGGVEIEENLEKSNSLFDVSGLQSLGVMRLIQNKLNTPNNSTEELDKEETSYQKPPEVKTEVQTYERPAPETRTYQYRAPSINMGTWSERPKVPVNVKEDPDYKHSSQGDNTKLTVTTTNNDIKSNNTVEVKNLGLTPGFKTNGVSVRVNPDYRSNVSIKVNGSEPISAPNNGNVVIKIGAAKPAIFRKPLGNVNKMDRPHSIAFGSDFDISRVPIVRSVEFKKPYKDLHNGTSVTQIFQNKTNALNSDGSEFSSPYRSSETLSVKTPVVEHPKPVFRLNSYVQGSAPVVRGFRSDQVKTWNQPHSFSTLPSKAVSKEPSVNKSVPFSQVNLRRTESTKTAVAQAPPPPMMPTLSKVRVAPRSVDSYSTADPKEQLLQAIRDFGGKKGLRAVRA